jgi:hypothetical protein
MVLDGRRVFGVSVGRKGGRVRLDIWMSGVAWQAHPRLVRLLNFLATAAMVNIVSSEDEASRNFSSNIDQNHVSLNIERCSPGRFSLRFWLILLASFASSFLGGGSAIASRFSGVLITTAIMERVSRAMQEREVRSKMMKSDEC